MRDALLDLVLGSSCVACGRPGRLLCRLCEAAAPRNGFVCWPTPCPPGLVLPVAAGEYDGLLKVLLNAHKERRAFALAAPLGMMLAHAVVALCETSPLRPGEAGAWVLVPVPSRRSVVRSRGHDPLLRLARAAATRLRGWGVRVTVEPVLRPTRRVGDQARLSAQERARNLSGSLAVVPPRARRLRSGPAQAIAVLVDDVITTGSTAREAQRALQEHGISVAGVAAVAATRRRRAPGTRDSGASLPISDNAD